MAERAIIHCRRCQAGYPDGVDGSSSTQGVDCAACICKTNDGKWLLIGNYPSDFDCDLFEFRSEPSPELQWADPICDACIRAMVDSGEIKFIREIRPFDEVDSLNLATRPKSLCA